jgi:hypothetical protein
MLIGTTYIELFWLPRSESVESFLYGLGRLYLKNMSKLRRIKFLVRLLQKSNNVLYNLFHVYLTDCFDTDDLLAFIF